MFNYDSRHERHGLLNPLDGRTDGPVEVRSLEFEASVPKMAGRVAKSGASRGNNSLLCCRPIESAVGAKSCAPRPPVSDQLTARLFWRGNNKLLMGSTETTEYENSLTTTQHHKRILVYFT
ncbi:hypothetical protein J6590_010039 [Homalodisca vitripennis]|nr:hypothetical protein J6590_010039 [Homalodisca vitripennis]